MIGKIYRKMRSIVLLDCIKIQIFPNYLQNFFNDRKQQADDANASDESKNDFETHK